MKDTSISWNVLQELTKEYGDAFYLLDEQRFHDNYRQFLSAFRSRYPATCFAYSYKTNYLPRLCEIVNELGGYAEVVSPMEYEVAIRSGVEPRQIIFNGPYKKEEDLKRALSAGSLVNLESAYEVEMVEKITRSNPGQTIRVGLRCNFELPDTPASRFGFAADQDGLIPIFERLTSLDNCQVEGLHCHLLTPQKSVAGYLEICDRILALAFRLFGKGGPRFIDLGGGFFSPMTDELRAQFPFPVPTYDDYGQAIGERMRAAFPEGNGPELILEPGISLTADIMRFACRVMYIKHVGKRTYGQLSGSVYNIKPTLNKKNLPMEVISNPDTPLREHDPIDLAGYTCMEHDLLFQGYTGELGRGDFVLFDNVGAYTIVLKPPFILPAPAILSYDAQFGTFTCVKRPEEFETLFSPYIFNRQDKPVKKPW